MTVTNENTTELLPEVEQKAIEYKFYGFDYKEIATMLKEEFPEVAPTYQLLRQWFMREGRLYEHYEKYNKEQTATNLKEATALWKGHSKNAMRTVLSLMKNATPGVKLSAAQEILGRAYGSVPKIVFQQENKDVFDDILKEIGLLQNEQRTDNKDI